MLNMNLRKNKKLLVKSNKMDHLQKFLPQLLPTLIMQEIKKKKDIFFGFLIQEKIQK